MVHLSRILIAKVILLCCLNFTNSSFLESSRVSNNLMEVPVLNLNFYMMNRSSADAEILKSIRENVAFLNEEFEEVVKFEIGQFSIDKGHGYLPDLHQEYFSTEELTVDSLVRDIEKEGGINIFIFDSYVIEEIDAELMGFTPIFKANHKSYEHASPGFDRIFLAYNALDKKTTLVHEMGHFLGLDHPWEMDHINKDLMGLVNEDSIQENHMAYGPRVEGFTSEQLARMQHFTVNFRNYLVKRKEYRIKDHLFSNL